MGKWSDADRVHALNLLTDGTTLADTHRQTGIPKSTLSGWAKRAGLDLGRTSRKMTEVAEQRWAERRVLLADRIGQVTDLALEQATGFLSEGRPREAKDAALTLAILVDKAQLLTGAATARTEHVAPDRTPEQEQELAQVLTLVQGAA